jgi:hypothetical protein
MRARDVQNRTDAEPFSSKGSRIHRAHTGRRQLNADIKISDRLTDNRAIGRWRGVGQPRMLGLSSVPGAEGAAAMYADDSRAPAARTSRMGAPSLLLVEPDHGLAGPLQSAMRGLVHVEWHADFHGARERMLLLPFTFLVTRLRLGAHNGLHLVHLAAARDLPARCIVHGDSRDWSMAGEVQRSGAFYERTERVGVTLKAYLRSPLPPVDRRASLLPDRRAAFRGGRRIGDPLHGAALAL